MRLSRVVFSVLLGLAMVSFVGQSVSHAASKAAKRVKDLNRTAMEEYDLLEFEAAKKKLNAALKLAKKSRLGKHPVTAQTYLYLGIVKGGGLGQKDDALLEFERALEIDPRAKLDPAYKTPELQKLYDQAKDSVVASGGGGGGDGDGDEDDFEDDEDDAPIRGLKHETIDETNGGKKIRVDVRVGNDVGAKRLVLFYRARGQEDFTPTTMKRKNRNSDRYRGTIPADATSGSSIHYYIQANNKRGKTMASSGSAGSPHIIMVNNPSGGGSDVLDDEDPFAEDNDRDSDSGNRIRRRRRSSGKSKVFINASIGSGIALVTGKTEQVRKKISCPSEPLCFAQSPVHIMPEIGFWISDQLAISLYGRIGFLLGANRAGRAPIGPAGLARVTYALAPDRAGLVVHGDVGFGFVRQTVKLNMVNPDEGDVDTYATGPLLLGGGLSYVKPLGESLRFLADANMLMGIPIIKEMGLARPDFGINVDLTIGLGVSF